MRYLPHTEAEVREMLEAIGVSSIDDLFAPIPAPLRSKPLDLEPALDEAALMAHLERLADKNEAAKDLSFLGAGMYDHHIPPAVDQLLLRSEFYTAYTPYQGEVSQGTLQAIFEFQTMVCELFDMEVANASMYDAASATAEAVLMARRIAKGKRNKVILSGALHPHAIDTVRTYLKGLDDEPNMVVTGVTADGLTDLDSVKDALAGEPAALVVGYPNFFGCVEDLEALGAAIHDAGGLLVTQTSEPYALSMLQAPGTAGADICVGEGQALAVPPQFGGPGVGLFACRQKFVRQMPGRLVGETVDETGKRCFVLTLSTREQHIRRDRATSNICTNHGLIALAFAIRTAMLGRSGFEQAGKTCLRAAAYLETKLKDLDGYELPYGAPTFNEVVVRRKAGKAAPMLAALAAQGILAGVDLGQFSDAWDHDFLVAVTEKHSKEDIDRLVDALASA
ncbi:MAG: aminomethyl-transferring glycine dehydrogenase subunit GcvPA [Deltaproteobacteria bacterium]|nr:aminomethyl-transferring glycine dehydrogenase subunit GcvPA [Deltaproteobacteria bacterium]